MIKLLDCTLRDGGYVNNWNFGKDTIRDITYELEKTKVDIVEIGFLKNEEYDEARTVFNRVEQISKYISKDNKDVKYAAMIDAMNPIPLEQITERSEDTVDIIRVMVWKSKHIIETGEVIDCLQEGFEYCKRVVEKGYDLCIQPARVDQYSDQEFEDMLRLFGRLNPLAIYVVDSWGTLISESIMHYVSLADGVLNQGIALGYHGHNNMMQAFDTAVSFLNYHTDRDKYLDASVYGMGRCAGNLNLEIIAHYLNTQKTKDYDIVSINRIYDKYIKEIRGKYNWGYSIPYFITGRYNCHPNYANYLCFEKNVNIELFEKIIMSIKGDDKILYCKELADKYLEMNV